MLMGKGFKKAVPFLLCGSLLMSPGCMMNAEAAGNASRSINYGAEALKDRALVAVQAEDGVMVSWRYYSSDSETITFTLKRNGTEVYKGGNTSFIDKGGRAGDSYQLTASEGASKNGETTTAWDREYLELTLSAPEPQTMPDGQTAGYTANDMSAGDLDGDGRLELVVKWDPDNSQDNSKDGYTGTTFLDGYDLDTATGEAELLWRIDLGVNIRSGAHYTQFQVWDYDGDGVAEIMCKTADGSTSYQNVNGKLTETGHVGAVSASALPVDKISTAYDFRTTRGRIVDGDEYLTVFNGNTGKIMDTVPYYPFRGTYDEETGVWDTTMWGLDSKGNKEPLGYANRPDRFLSATAYLDGKTPSAVFCRGYYGRTAMAAWNLVNGKLVQKWTFDVPTGDEYAGQGNHGLSVNDVDGDGKDEIIYGSLTVDHNGTPLYTTGLGHGDAMHVSDWNGDGRLEIFQVHEEKNARYHVELHDAETGEILWGYNYGSDTGRGVAADIDPRYPGAEMWAAVKAVTYDVNGNRIYNEGIKPSQNFSIFWDGDLLMELFDSNDSKSLVPQIQKWDYENGALKVITQMDGTKLNNSTKANAGLIADILGDWREEVIVRDEQDNNKIRIYTTPIETAYRIPCLLEDLAYREGVAWQNVGYNQPANLSYLLSAGVKAPKVIIGEKSADRVVLTWEAASDGLYGHEVEGYEIYRGALDEVFVKVGTVTGDAASYTDTGLKPNKEYQYKIAAVVDGKASYVSFPVTAKTAVSAAGVKEFEKLILAQDLAEFAEAFPKEATIILAGGEEQKADITWDLTGFDIGIPGDYTVYGSIPGYSEKVPISVTVEANRVESYVKAKDVYTLTGKEPVLPETMEVVLLNGGKVTLPVIWEKTYNVNTTGNYTVPGSVTTSYGEKAAVEITVLVRDDYKVSVNAPAAVEAVCGSDARDVLPDRVSAVFAKDGRTGQVDVTWDEVDTSAPRTVTAIGHVEDYAGLVEAEVRVDYPVVWKFDFGIEGSPVSEGWTGITVNKSGGKKTAEQLNIHYTAARGYGFTGWENKGAIEGRSQNYTQEGIYPPEVYKDLALASTAAQSNTFVADVENGTYIVEMMSGSTDSSTVKVTIEGKAFSVKNSASAYQMGRFEGIQVTDGQMTMEFPSGNYSRLNAVVIRKVN